MLKPTKYYSSIQERSVAASLGWRVVSGSGSRPGHPGDVVSDDWLVECKTHVKSQKNVVFFLAAWNKLCNEATSTFKFPMLIADDGTQDLNRTWCLLNTKSVPFEIELCNLPNVKVSTNIILDPVDTISMYSVTQTKLHLPSNKLLLVEVNNHPDMGVCPFSAFQTIIRGD